MRSMMFAAISLFAVDAALAQDVYTRPYVRRDGTPVQGHYSTQPNEYRYDNYSSRGNVNPYTGERGSQRNEFTIPPAFNTGHRNSDSLGTGNMYGNPYGLGGRSRSRDE